MDLGNRTEDSVVDFTFTTRQATGAPYTLAGTPAVSVYKANGTSASTAGVTLTVDFNSTTGLNHVRIDTSADAFYAVNEDYSVVITAGTVNSVSVVGETVATFSIEKRFNEADVVKWSGSAVAAPATAGVPKVDLVRINNATVPIANTTDLVADAAVPGDVWDVERASHTTAGTFGEVTEAADVATAVAAQTDIADMITKVDNIAAGSTAVSATLADGVTHGGSAASLTLKNVVVSRSDAGVAVAITNSDATGSSHAINVLGNAGSALRLASTLNHAMTIDAPGTGAKALLISGQAADIDADITGTLSALTVTTTAEPGAGAPDAAGTLAGTLAIQRALLRNKRTTDTATGVTTVFADDGTTALFTFQITEADGVVTRSELAAP